MGYQTFRFNKNNFSYKEIESFCIKKELNIDKNHKNNDFYPSYIRENQINFIINEYIYVKENRISDKDSYAYISTDISYSPESKKYTHFNIEYISKGKKELKEQYLQAEQEYKKLKKEINKIYNSLKRKFGLSKEEKEEIDNILKKPEGYLEMLMEKIRIK